MTRFLHTADWQLGMTRHFLAADDAQPRFTAARLEAIGRIGEVVRAQGCAFVVVCGDVFETNLVSDKLVRRALAELAGVPTPVYLLPGNHDPLAPGSVYRREPFARDRPKNVHLLDSTAAVPVAPGVELIGAPWPSTRPARDLATEAIAELAPRPGVHRVLVAHGGVDVLSPDSANPSNISLAELEAALAAGVLDYVALGDRHSRTAVGETGRIWYAGTPEPTDYDEVDPGQVLVVDLDPRPGTPGRPVPQVSAHQVATWAFRTERAELNALGDVEQLHSRLAAAPNRQRTILRIEARGTLGLAEHARYEEVLAEAADHYAALERHDRASELVVRPEDTDYSELGLGGFALAALGELRDRADGLVEAGGVPPGAPGGRVGGRDPGPSIPDAQVATDALALLYRLVRRPGS